MIARVLVALATGAALGVSPAAAPAAPAGVELASDPIFESVGDPGGSPWQCDASTSSADGPPIGSEFTQVIGERDGEVPGNLPPAPVEPPKQLLGGPTPDNAAGCAQVVPVQPGATYALSAVVRGGPAVLGTEYGSVNNGGASRAKTLRTTFTVAGDRDAVRIAVRGVTGGAPYDAWGVSLVGPPSRVRAPQPPTRLRTDRRTNRTVRLSWRSAPGATGYRVLRAGVPVITTTETSALLTGLTPDASPSLTVIAFNPGGESVPSAPLAVAALPAWTSPPGTPTDVVVTPRRRPGQAIVEFTAPPRVTDGYEVSVDGVRVGWMYESPATLVDLADGPHQVTVTALNAVGPGAPSAPVTVVIGTD